MATRSVSTLRLLGCIAILACLVGCVGPFKNWSLFDKKEEAEAKKDEPAKLLQFVPEVVFEKLWRVKVGKGLGRKYLELSPAVVGDRVYAADAYGIVVALDSVSGRAVWETRVGKPATRRFFDVSNRSDPAFVAGGVGVGDGLVLVGTVHGELIALEIADGKERWRAQLSGEVLAPAEAREDVVVAQTSDGKLFALENETGEVRWIFDTQDPIVTLRGTGSPVISQGHVYAGFANGLVAAVEIPSGFPSWEQRVSLPEGTSELDRMVDVDGRPLVLGGRVFAVSHQGKLRAMQREDGSILWEKEAPSHHALVEGYDLLFIVTDDDLVIAAEQNGGTEVWKQESFYMRVLTDPLAYGNYVVVGDAKGFIHVIAQSDGRLLGRTKMRSAIRSAMVVSNGVVYAIDSKGNLQALRIKRIG